MSNFLIDTNTDFNFDNIIIGKKIKQSDLSSRYYIYYQSEPNETPKEIYIKVPKTRLLYGLANHKYDQVNIPIYPNHDLTNKFIKFIKDFEDNIKECFQNKPNFNSLINKKKNHIELLKTNITNIKITSDMKKNITLEDFKINGLIELVIKISYIWNKDTKYGLSSHIYQIKYHAPPDQLNINFIDSIPITEEKNIYKETETEMKTEVLEPQKKIMKMMILPSDLTNALKSLKASNKKI
jgi:hypothetical protein